MPSWTVEEALSARAAAPLVAFEALCEGDGAVVVVAPHPDDETLGCGGLIAMAADRGRRIAVLLLTDGDASHPGSRTHPAARLAELRRIEARAALDVLAGDRAVLESFGAPDGRLEARALEASAWLATRLEAYGASSVFACWQADPHPDHRAASAAAVQATRAMRLKLWSYPVWGLTAPGEAYAGARGAWARLDVGAVLSRKREALARHASQTTDLIADDMNGFRLTPDDLARHLSGIETFLSTE